MNKRKPVIGIVAKQYATDFLGWTECVFYDHVRVSLLQNGALPIGILPCRHNINVSGTELADLSASLTEQEKTDLTAILKLCDGVVLQGGISDEAYETFCAQWCKDNNMPVLGICSGFNNMVTVCGGICEKDSELAKTHNIESNEPSHEIDIIQGSLLHKIIGKRKLYVNSLHTYFTRETGCARAIAKHRDGTVEAIELKGHPFFLGCKFHPEVLLQNEDMQKIFAALIKAAGEKIKCNKG